MSAVLERPTQPEVNPMDTLRFEVDTLVDLTERFRRSSLDATAPLPMVETSEVDVASSLQGSPAVSAEVMTIPIQSRPSPDDLRIPRFVLLGESGGSVQAHLPHTGPLDEAARYENDIRRRHANESPYKKEHNIGWALRNLRERLAQEAVSTSDQVEQVVSTLLDEAILTPPETDQEVPAVTTSEERTEQTVPEPQIPASEMDDIPQELKRALTGDRFSLGMGSHLRDIIDKVRNLFKPKSK